MPSSRRPQTDKQRETQTASKEKMRQMGYEDALARRAADEEYIKSQELNRQRRSGSNRRGAPLISVNRGNRGGDQTANYQKHTLIALTTAFLITMFSNTIGKTVGKVSGGTGVRGGGTF